MRLSQLLKVMDRDNTIIVSDYMDVSFDKKSYTKERLTEYIRIVL